MYGYLIVRKRTKMYMKPNMMTVTEAKVELATTAARLSGTRGRNTKAWFLPAELHKNFMHLVDHETTTALIDFLKVNAKSI